MNCLTGIGTTIARGLLRLLSMLPLRVHYFFAGFLSWLAKSVLRYRRDLVMTNLARAFPEKKYKELKAVSDQFYRHFGDLIAEAVWFGGCRNPERLRKQHLVEFKDFEVFEQAYSDSPGVIVMNSHCGNWELVGGFESYDYRENVSESDASAGKVSKANFVTIYKKLKSEMWDRILKENRCAPAGKDYKLYVESQSILRFALANRGRKMVYVFPTDQCPYKFSTADDDVTFMHQKTKTMLGAASIACKFGFSVLYMNLCPVSRGHYEWRFREICKDASSRTPHDIMQEYYDLLAADLEKTPWNYLWTHNRWKK